MEFVFSVKIVPRDLSLVSIYKFYLFFETIFFLCSISSYNSQFLIWPQDNPRYLLSKKTDLNYALLLFRMYSRVLYSTQQHKQHCIHSRPLNSLEHCICTTAMTNIRPDRHSSLVPPGYKPRAVDTNVMSHRGRSPWLMHKLNPIAMLVGTPMEDLKVKS